MKIKNIFFVGAAAAVMGLSVLACSSPQSLGERWSEELWEYSWHMDSHAARCQDMTEEIREAAIQHFIDGMDYDDIHRATLVALQHRGCEITHHYYGY